MDTEQTQIQLLPEHIIDQIKAGEVIERPSTLIKELLENSIDAKATKITVEIIENGLNLIHVKDNGVGIKHDEIDLAFSRHATSKIENFDDIYKLHTYGFRGEALASIASISKVSCITNRKDAPESTFKINGGQVELYEKDSSNSSESKTEIYIKDLFYNTPVRMKFLQSQGAEKNNLKRILNAFLLSHPEVEYSIKWDEEKRKSYPKLEADNFKKRFEDFLSKKRDEFTVDQIQNEYDQTKINLLYTNESSKATIGKYQFLFVNKRLVTNMKLHKIICNTLAPVWWDGSGHYCLFIDMPGDQIDVNVHPNKTVVKFFESQKVFSLVSSSIKTHLHKQQEQRSHFQDNARQESLLDASQSESNLSYRSFDFSGKQDLDSYFHHLDRRSQSEASEREIDFQCLQRMKNFLIIKHEDSLLILNIEKFLDMILANSCLDKKTVPLLISMPIKIKSQRDLKLIGELGYELDSVGDNEYLLRSFPQSLAGLDHESLINDLSTDNQTSIRDKLSDHFIISKLRTLGLEYFLRQQIVKKLTNNHLKALW